MRPMRLSHRPFFLVLALASSLTILAPPEGNSHIALVDLRADNADGAALNNALIS